MSGRSGSHKLPRRLLYRALWLLILLLLLPRSEAAERQQDRDRMVRELAGYGYGDTRVTDSKVLSALRRVPRHEFVPAYLQIQAYADRPLPIGHGQTISQPYVVALMTQLADIAPGMRVLEVGTGSGYQAAVLAELTDKVYTIEIVVQLAAEVRQRFRDLGLKNIIATEGDGYFGWPAYAPFDRILVTAAASHIPPDLVKQLVPGGRMVIPVGPKWGAQRLMLVLKDESGQVTTRSLLPVRFVPLMRKHDSNR